MNQPDQAGPLEHSSALLREGFGLTGIPAVPDHQLFRLIASGAYGEVWLGCNAVGTRRAVKIVRREQHASAESFEREFKGLQKFEPVSRSHQGLVDILTLGLLTDGTGFYYIMELADDVAAVDSTTTEPASSLPSSPVEAYRPRTLRWELKSRGALPTEEVITRLPLHPGSSMEVLTNICGPETRK